MSSILDALKKSEAERQRGTPPTLDSPIAFRRRPAPARGRPVWLLPALAVAALAGAWYGGLLPFSGSSPLAPATSESAEQGAAAAPASTPPDQAPTAAVEPPVPTPAVPVAAAPPPEASAPPPAQAPDPAGNVPSRGFYSGGAASTNAIPTPAPASPGAVSDAPAEPPAAPTVAAGADQASANPAPFVPAPPSVSGDVARPADPAAGPPSVHELPFAVRRELPELNVTMHMFSADPQRRFVLLNGERARDGDTLESGLEVVEIRATEIVLRFQDTEFVLPLRG
jgi:general secretion pathway protein B